MGIHKHTGDIITMAFEKQIEEGIEADLKSKIHIQLYRSVNNKTFNIIYQNVISEIWTPLYLESIKILGKKRKTLYDL